MTFHGTIRTSDDFSVFVLATPGQIELRSHEVCGGWSTHDGPAGGGWSYGGSVGPMILTWRGNCCVDVIGAPTSRRLGSMNILQTIHHRLKAMLSSTCFVHLSAASSTSVP